MLPTDWGRSSEASFPNRRSVHCRASLTSGVPFRAAEVLESQGGQRYALCHFPCVMGMEVKIPGASRPRSLRSC